MEVEGDGKKENVEKVRSISTLGSNEVIPNSLFTLTKKLLLLESQEVIRDYEITVYLINQNKPVSSC